MKKHSTPPDNKHNFEENKVEKLSFFLFFISFLFYRFISFLFYRRLPNCRRTTVRLRSQTPLSYLNPFTPRLSLIV